MGWPTNKSDLVQLSCKNFFLYQGRVVNVVGTYGRNPTKPIFVDESTGEQFVPEGE